MKKTITVGTRQFEVTNTDRIGLPHSQEFASFYEVACNGNLVMYAGKGHKEAPRQIVIWYAKTGQMWSSYGDTFAKAVEGALDDAFWYV